MDHWSSGPGDDPGMIPRYSRPQMAAIWEPENYFRIQLDIEVDGGIKIDNVDRVARAGANVIVSGSGIFLEKDYRTTIARMRERAELARR